MTEDEITEAATGERDDEAVAEEAVAEEAGTEIRETDIVFDCPHCGHNLAIDYRGAGLQINCVNCGESVLVPIPDGMKIDDLDIEPGEILKQLFKTRRDLQKQEGRVTELEERLRGVVAHRDALLAQCEAFAMQVAELRAFCQQQTAAGEKMAALLDRISSDFAAGGADGASPAGASAGTDAAEAAE